MKPLLMSQKAYAERRRVSPQYVNKLVGQGKIQKVGRQIDARQADAALKAFSRPGRAKEPKPQPRPRRSPKVAPAKRPAAAHLGPSATRSLTEARAQREHFNALQAKLDYERASGTLLPRDQVLDLERRKNANIRTLLRRLPRSVAPLLARAGGPAEIETLLLSEIDLVLEQLARNPLGMRDDAPPPITEPEAAAIIAPAAPAVEVAEAS